MKTKILGLPAIALLAGSMSAHAVIVIGSAGQAYTQNFDTLTSTAALGQAWTNDSTLAGWSLFSQPAPGSALTTYAGGTGSNNTGSFYSFGAAGSTERALGGVGSGGTYFGAPASGAVAGWIAVAFTNTSGGNLNGFSITFNGEQWRDGGNATPVAQTMVFQFGFGSTFDSVSTWSTPGGLFDWSSPLNTTTAGAVNGNVGGRVAGLGGTIDSLWGDNQTLWLRWVERNDVGNDQGLAIDDLSFTAGRTVPEPGTLALLGLSLAGLGLSRRRKA